MKNIWNIVIGIFLGSLFSYGLWMAIRPPQGESVILLSPPTPVPIMVNIVGAVVHPGTYRLSKFSRIVDVVQAAGGFTGAADTNSLNLAAHVNDEQKLDIPYKKQKNTIALTDTPTPLVKIKAIEVTATASSTESNNVNTPTDIQPTNIPSSSKTDNCAVDMVGRGAFVWPTDNHSLSGNDYGPEHPGIDLTAGEGSPVYAADSGIVMAAGDDDTGYGKVIQIDHGNGYYTMYAHLSTIKVNVSQCVRVGQVIGAAGSTGNSEGAHLHFAVMQKGYYVNPGLVLP